MKIGFSTACLENLSIENLSKWSSEQGFKSLELPVSTQENGNRPAQLILDHFTQDDLSRIKENVLKYNLEISCLGYHVNNIDPETAKREYYNNNLKKVIGMAKSLDVSMVSTFVGGRPDKQPFEMIKEIGTVFQDIVKYANDSGVKIIIENSPMMNWHRFGLPGNYAFSPELWEAIFNEVPDDNFGLNFDPSHLFWLDIDYIKCVYAFADKIFHTHAKDAEVIWENMDYFGILSKQLDTLEDSGWWRYRIPGKGEIDWKMYISALEEIGYNGILSIEHEDPIYTGSEEKIKEGLKLGLKHLSQYIIT